MMTIAINTIVTLVSDILEIKIMAFLYKAFIRKNTPELRAKLEDFGYTNGAWESPRFHYPYLSVLPNPKFGLFKGEGFYMTEDDYRLDGEVLKYNPKEDVIDCGDNEELFLAIAALKDNTDKNQWFIYDTMDCHIKERRTITWLICEEDKIEDMMAWDCAYKNARKASVEELIEHFN